MASKVKASAGARHVTRRGLPAPAILANGINGRAMEEAQREVAEEAEIRRLAAEVLDCAVHLCRAGDPMPRLTACDRLTGRASRKVAAGADDLAACAAAAIAEARGKVRDDVTLGLAAELVRSGWRAGEPLPATRQADGINRRDLSILSGVIPTGAALVGIWPADLFALEAAGWSEVEAQRARSTGAAWFAEVNHPRATCEESTLYALTSSGWKEVI